MINYNGNFIDQSNTNLINRGFLFGDCVFDTLKIVNNNILFWEEHYLRLMSSIRVLRMEIPDKFTPDFLEKEIFKTNSQIDSNFSGRVRLSVFRSGGGLYSPESSDPSYVIESKKSKDLLFKNHDKPYKVDLYKDYFIQPNFLSNLKTNNKILNVIGSVYASENELDNCVLLNDNKDVTEFLNGNIFIVNGSNILTPPLTSGCLNGVMRKKIIEMINASSDLEINETKISPFELISSDEIWLTNSICGVIAVSDYRNKKFSNNKAKRIIELFNMKIKNI
ncbi:MAG: aminotransferase class IV [Bacteroidetes bacterium]|jgi:branched-chain amino acid aminotransferase|nr:MAG: aminotransferase class IV [Cryomorphaceae bacterium BACL29 MAG-121220-bin8]MDA0758421.1 aminotransferase class IV [Bacteroidota bacterium]MDA1019414.1 aminotransferase class IV [Bacteroidota bacterium]|tara:strand:- start:4644 stop:5480 length:837 start_codon:yes stop_codon:yes gene_type:complete